MNDDFKEELRDCYAEIERLRAALSTISNTRVSSWVGDIHGDTQNEWRDGLDEAISIARAALAQEKHDE